MPPKVRRGHLLKMHQRQRKLAEARREWIVLNVTGLVLIIAGLVLTFFTMKLILLGISGLGMLFLAKATWFPTLKGRIKRSGGGIFPDFGDIRAGHHHHGGPDIDLSDIDLPDIDWH